MSGVTSGTGAPGSGSCAGCEADDRADWTFVVAAVVPAPHTTQLLVSVRCLTCGRDHDLAVWAIDRPRFISELGLGISGDAGKIAAAALVERYHGLLKRHHHQIGRAYKCRQGRAEHDTFEVNASYAPGPVEPPMAVPMAVLAVCRALRQVVAARPGAQPPVGLQLGDYRCEVSFDETPQRPYPYALHVSLGNGAMPGQLPRLDRLWLLSLFFTPGELPLLEIDPGRVHHYLPAYSPNLDPDARLVGG